MSGVRMKGLKGPDRTHIITAIIFVCFGLVPKKETL